MDQPIGDVRLFGRADPVPERPALRAPGAILSGWIVTDDGAEKVVWGRPVDVLVARDGSLLLSEDGGNRIHRVSYRR